jgi:bacillopeptidase F
MPLAVRVALLAAVATLALVVVATLGGVMPRVVSGIGTTLGGIAGNVFATPEPVETVPVIPAPPSLSSPDNPYTKKPTAVVSGAVPAEVVGRPGYSIRIYVTLPDQEPTAVRDVAIGETSAFQVEDVPLEVGRNDVSATLVGPGGESDPSPVVTYVYDKSKPKITVTSPKNGATVNGPVAKIRGKTQGRSRVVARNEANGTAATAEAADDGTFKLAVPLSAGRNAIALTATDLAGNVSTAVLTVRRGSGDLTLALTASAYRVSAARLPRAIELRAQVTDPNARALPGQTVTFTLSIPGVPTITGEDTTDGSGRATFRTTIPKGATVGAGLATALVSTREYGDASDKTSIAIVK